MEEESDIVGIVKTGLVKTELDPNWRTVDSYWHCPLLEMKAWGKF